MSLEQAAARLAADAIQCAASRQRRPRATYRLQLHARFKLQDAVSIVPYLDQLGVSHLYVSSLAAAKSGSLHGYDVIDHGRLNPELGTVDDLAALAAELHRRDMGIILDIVPNHMHIGPENVWWNDVLENGPSSPYAGYFDIAWHDHPRERLRGKVLLPILDEPYGRALEAGRFQPGFENGAFHLAVNQLRLPIDPRTYGTLLALGLDAARSGEDAESPGVLELQSILNAVRHLPPREEPDADRVREGLAETMVVKRRLRELAEQHPQVAAHLEQAAREAVGQAGDTTSFARLAELLDAQAYRPCFWRVALDEINYRRFFDVNDLAALSTEREEVFRAIHAQPLAWVQQGLVDGLRIDHVDGLLDPDEYLQRLQHHALLACARGLLETDAARYEGTTWADAEPLLLSAFAEAGNSRRLTYLVVEKILAHGESLPTSWPCDGTTGYDCLNEMNGLFVDPTQAEAFEILYRRFIGRSTPFEQISHDAKTQVMQSLLSSELHMLAHRLDRLAQANWWSQDFTLNGLRHALREVIACFPVYRTYIAKEASAADRAIVLRAVHQARGKDPLLGREVFGFIADTLLLNEPHATPSTAAYQTAQREIAGKFQQLTSPVMAKGVEDTALYRFNRLASLNEVSGEPTRFGRSPVEVHDFLRSRAQTWPGSLTPLSTHDTKRSEDVRARLNVLSEWPEEWGRRVGHWSHLNRRHRLSLEDGTLAPDANEEYLLYQTLVGCWLPEMSLSNEEFLRRIQAYMMKATREAKIHSSWINPDPAYDAAVGTFIARILDPTQAPEFLQDFQQFQQRVHRFGSINSLAQTLIRCTAPGVPDTYQGTEFFDYSLVDPDNRRPVDYAARQAALQELKDCREGLPSQVRRELGRLSTWDATKLFVTTRGLNLRRELPDVFEQGDYVALEVQGPHAAHAFGFLRAGKNAAVLTMVPRLVATLVGANVDVGDLRLSLDATVRLPAPWHERRWRNVFTNRALGPQSESLPAKAIFEEIPVALWATCTEFPERGA